MCDVERSLRELAAVVATVDRGALLHGTVSQHACRTRDGGVVEQRLQVVEVGGQEPHLPDPGRLVATLAQGYSWVAYLQSPALCGGLGKVVGRDHKEPLVPAASAV